MTMTASELVEEIQSSYEGELAEAEARSEVDAWVGVAPQEIQKIIRHLRDTHAPVHLSTITGVDLGESIGVIYHCVAKGVSLNVHTAVPKGDDRIESITPVLPAAILYEREVHDLLGVEFVGHPDMRRLILPEEWPEDDHPLRQDDADPAQGGKESEEESA